jgi:uncharacterized membrane protein YphA (DoxX/SURF4 family)
MKIAALIARILLGLLFLVFGLNGFLHFIPQPPLPEGLMKQFTEVMTASHYFLFISAVEVVASVLFLINRFVPLALVLIGPVLVNILIFHLCIAPSSIGAGLVATALWFVVFYVHRAAFSGIFAAKA